MSYELFYQIHQNTYAFWVHFLSISFSIWQQLLFHDSVRKNVLCSFREKLQCSVSGDWCHVTWFTHSFREKLRCSVSGNWCHVTRFTYSFREKLRCFVSGNWCNVTLFYSQEQGVAEWALNHFCCYCFAWHPLAFCSVSYVGYITFLRCEKKQLVTTEWYLVIPFRCDCFSNLGIFFLVFL